MSREPDAAETEQRRSTSLAEATPLCLVVVMTLLGNAGLRALALKGVAFATLGVRELKISADVDVLVEPYRFEDALRCLQDAGWTIWELAPLWTPFEAHSVTLEHAYWPCTIDVHWRFPGFFAPPQQTFDVFWESRTSVLVAHQPVLTLSRPHALALDTLHVLRNTAPHLESGAVAAVLDSMPERLTLHEKRQLFTMSVQTGSLMTLQTLLRLARVTDPALPTAQEAACDDPNLASWRSRQLNAKGSVSWWLSQLRARPASATSELLALTWLSDAQAQTWARAKKIPYHGHLRIQLLRWRRAVAMIVARWLSRD